MEAIEWADEAGLPLQINTTFSRCNIDDFERVATLIESKKIRCGACSSSFPPGGANWMTCFGRRVRCHLRQTVRTLEASAFSHQDYGSATVVSSRSSKLPQGATELRRSRAGDDWSGASRLGRWQRLRIPIAQGRGFPRGFLPFCGRQRAVNQDLSRVPNVPAIARCRPIGGKCGACEFRHSLRRFARSRLRGQKSRTAPTYQRITYRPRMRPYTHYGLQAWHTRLSTSAALFSL
jgi:hypothetical protein